MVGSRSGGKAGKLVYEYIMESCNIHRQDKSAYDTVIKTYLKYDGTLSFTDASTVEIMKFLILMRLPPLIPTLIRSMGL